MARLILNPTSPSSRQVVGLHRLPLSIGRDPSNDLVITDEWVSRRHAVVDWQGNGYRLRDCNSSNGSVVNGDRLTERRLCDGDLVAIGAARLLFQEASLDAPKGDEAARAAPGPAVPRPHCCPYCETPSLRGDLFCRECGRRLAIAWCAACDAVVARARFCTACGSLLASREGAQGSSGREKAIDKPLPGDGSATTGGQPRRPPGGLSAQHASLVRAVALRRADYLSCSYYRDPSTGQRMAHPLEEKEWSRFAAYWAVEPIACIRAMNAAIAVLRTPARIRRYLEAAVELETLMDRGALRAPGGRVFSGIPRYIMDGYTDMGHNPSPAARRGREKIRVDKQSLKPWLIESRWRALAYEPALPELLAGFYEVVRRSLSLDEARVRRLSNDWGDRSINLSRFLDDGVGLCRHLSILYQLCLQEAGIPARVVKGTLRVFGIGGRHAWNLAWLGGRVALVDVTLPSRHGPLILVGASQVEVYRMANEGERRYIPTPDEQNHYKIGRPADQGPSRAEPISTGS